MSWNAIGFRFAVIYATAEDALRRIFGLDRALYTWSGAYFGLRVKDGLFTSDGTEVGRFQGDEIYDHDGRYLGELKEGRLVTHQAKKSKCWVPFTPSRRRPHTPQVDLRPKVLYTGFEHFPDPQRRCRDGDGNPEFVEGNSSVFG
jgi:hypothetical protein